MQLKVQVWIHCTDQKQRLWVAVFKTLPSRGGFWQPVTGHVESGESVIDAANRESEEETGLNFQETARSLDYNVSFTGRDGRHVLEEVFERAAHILLTPIAATGTAQQACQILPKIKIDSCEHSEAKWVLAEEASMILKYDSNRDGLDRLIKGCRDR